MASPKFTIPAGFKLPEGKSVEDLVAAMQLMTAFADAQKAEREAAAKKRADAFDAVKAEVSATLDAIVNTHELETWYKTDPKTKTKTEEVSGIGFHAQGTTTLTFPDGTTRKVSVNIWVKANPKAGGIPPEADGDSEGSEG